MAFGRYSYRAFFVSLAVAVVGLLVLPASTFANTGTVAANPGYEIAYVLSLQEYDVVDYADRLCIPDADYKTAVLHKLNLPGLPVAGKLKPLTPVYQLSLITDGQSLHRFHMRC